MARYVCKSFLFSSPLFARTTKREIVVGKIESSKAKGKRTFDGELVSGTWDVQQHTTTSLGVIASAKIRHALLASLVYVHVACYVIRSWSIIIVVRYSLARLRCSQTGNLVYFLFFFSFLFRIIHLLLFFRTVSRHILSESLGSSSRMQNRGAVHYAFHWPSKLQLSTVSFSLSFSFVHFSELSYRLRYSNVTRDRSWFGPFFSSFLDGKTIRDARSRLQSKVHTRGI